MTDDDKTSKLSITRGSGFQLTFSNGYTVSVQFGYGNYCDRRHDTEPFPNTAINHDSMNAEIAAWDANGEWYDLSGDQVEGWCSADRVGAFISGIMQLPAAPKLLPTGDDEALRCIKEAFSPSTCTGAIQSDGRISHDGDTCPIHEYYEENK